MSREVPEGPHERTVGRFQMLMERARWHYNQSHWYEATHRASSPRRLAVARKSAAHHQRQAARLYAEAREERDLLTPNAEVSGGRSPSA